MAFILFPDKPFQRVVSFFKPNRQLTILEGVAVSPIIKNTFYKNTDAAAQFGDWQQIVDINNGDFLLQQFDGSAWVTKATTPNNL